MACFSISGRILYGLKASFPGWFPKLMGPGALTRMDYPVGKGVWSPKDLTKKAKQAREN